ncbi:hypothetical protein Gpo141_00007454 [Globisporangium polare]
MSIICTDNVKTESYWISNQVYLKDATFELVEKLAGLASISEIHAEQVLPTSKITMCVATTTASGIAPLVTKAGASTVWATGNTSAGVVVGSLRRFSCEALCGASESPNRLGKQVKTSLVDGNHKCASLW